MSEKRDVLRDLCKRLLRHHRESERVCRGLEEVDKACEPHHEPSHAHHRDFYERISHSNGMERALHLPKIIKDALLLKKRRKVLEKRRHALKVYKTLKESGAEFGWTSLDDV